MGVLDDGAEAVRGRGGKFLEEIWKGLIHAGGIFDFYAGNFQSQSGETHCHAMVIVGFDFSPVQRAGKNFEGVGDFMNARAAFAKFSPERGDAFAFLDAQPSEVCKTNRAAREWRDDDGGHDAISQFILTRDLARQIGVDPFWKPGVDLQEFLRPLLDGDARGGGGRGALEKPASGPEIAGARRIGFDWKNIPCLLELVHQRRSHRDVRGLFGVFAGDFDLPAADLAGHEQRGSELRTFGEAHATFATFWTFALDPSGKAIVEGIDVVSEFAEGVKQRALGTLMHALDAAQTIEAAAEANHGGEEAGSSAGIANKKFEWIRARAGVRNLPGSAANANGAIGALFGIGLNGQLKTEPAEAFDHDLGIFAPERAGEGDFVFAERGENERAVGDAFGAWNAHVRVDRTREWFDFD